MAEYVLVPRTKAGLRGSRKEPELCLRWRCREEAYKFGLCERHYEQEYLTTKVTGYRGFGFSVGRRLDDSDRQTAPSDEG